MTDIDVSNVTMTVIEGEPEPSEPDRVAALEAEVAELRSAVAALLAQLGEEGT